MKLSIAFILVFLLGMSLPKIYEERYNILWSVRENYLLLTLKPRFKAGDCIVSFKSFGGYYRNILGIEGIDYKVLIAARSETPDVAHLDIVAVDEKSESQLVECLK